MPAEQINFRYEVPESTGVQLLYRLKRAGWLTEGMIHFPTGCSALVQVRMLLGLSGKLIQVTPIENQFIALDGPPNYVFPIDRQVAVNDEIWIELNNYDGTNHHQISVVISWATERYVWAAEDQKLRDLLEKLLSRVR